MKLKDLLHRARFDNGIKSEMFHFRNETYELLRAKRSEKLLPSIPFSEYFFIELPNAAMTKMSEGEELSYFHDFQTKLLSKPFFSYKSDMRWNLYLILVIESYELLKDNRVLQKIENDADYARKFIVTPDDILSLLDREWLHTAANETELADPLQEWGNQLDPLQLTGCLTQTFGKDHIHQYVAGHPFTAEGAAPAAGRRSRTYNDYEEKISNINSISFDGFRKHCFAQLDPIHPTNVNLLHGTNGSGKTSAMEAIELALTNDIRRCSEFGDKVEDTANQLQVLCKTDSGRMLPFQSGKPVALYKQLAQSWYGVTSGRQSELNYYFHRFNYFDSEAAYRFALSESGNADHEKFDYSDNLSRLVFGESILAAQKKWQRYKDGFDDQLKDLTRQKTEVSSLKASLGEKIASLNQSHTNAIQPIEVDRLLSSIHLRESVIEREPSKPVLEHLERIHLFLKSVEPRRRQIIEFPISHAALTWEQIQIQLQTSNEKLDSLLLDKENRVALQLQLKSEQGRINSEIVRIGEQELFLQQSLDVAKRDLLKWKEIRNVLEGHSRIQQRRELEQKSDLLSGKFNVLQNFEARYSRLASLTNDDLFLLPPEELQQLQQAAEEKTMLLSQSNEQLKTIEKLMGEVHALVSHLQHLGKDYLHMNGNATACPLCKHEYGTHIELTDAIQSAISVNMEGNNSLDELRQRIESLQSDIVHCNDQMERQHLNRRHVKEVSEAYIELANHHLFEIDVTLHKPEDQLQLIHSLLAAQIEWKKQHGIIRSQLQLLDESGFSNNDIIRADLFQKESMLYKEYTEQQSTNSFEEYVIAQETGFHNKTKEVKYQLAQLRNQAIDLQQRLLLNSFEEINQTIANQEKEIGLWNHLKEGIAALLSDFEFDQQDNLRTWAIQLEQASMQIELLIEKHKHDQELTKLKTEWEEAGKTYEMIQNKIDRCKLACEALGQLRALKSYTEQFIHKNIAQIERFFKMLHAPREFDNIQLGEDGLILLRKWDGHHVKAFQMSSGQRASLALSVMFAVHLAAPNAPKFIIMDEPVANMDDLHLMNLLDLLRDFVLSGRQIFFTTANPDVANLFRRKFSFFQEQFTHFEFTRHSGEPVHIKAMQYSPDRENPFSQTS